VSHFTAIKALSFILLLMSTAAAAAPAKLEVVGAFADADQDRADNVYDRELAEGKENGWGAPGDGHWVTLDLGKPCTVSAVRIAFHKGRQKLHTFEIQVSLDNSEYHVVLTGMSGGKSDDLERFEFPAAAGRYVRFVGHTIQRADWSAVMELEAWGIADGGSSASADELGYQPPQPRPDNPTVELPKRARGRAAGRFSFRVRVGEDGAVKAMSPVWTPSGVGLEEAIAKTVTTKWRFAPARRGNTTVSGMYAATVEMFSDDREETELKQLAGRFFEGYNAGTVETVLGLLDPDRRILFSNHEVPPSPGAARAWLTERFAQASRPRFSDLRYERLDLDPFGDLGPLNRQLATVLCSVRVDGQEVPPSRVYFDSWWVKRGETGWRAVRLVVPRRPEATDAPEAKPSGASEPGEGQVGWTEDNPTAVSERMMAFASVKDLPVRRAAVVEVLLDAEGKALVIEVLARSPSADDALIKTRLLRILGSIRRNYDGKPKIVTFVVTDI